MINKIAILFLSFLLNSYSYSKELGDSISKWHSNNIFKINVIGLFSNFTEFSYERVLSEKYSASITYGKGREKTTSGEEAKQNYIDRYNSYNLNYILGNVEQTVKIKSHFGVDFRYYLSFKHTRIPAGFHIGPMLNFLSYNEKFIFYDDQGVARDLHETNYSVTSININLGPQFLIHRIVVIELFVAPGYGILNVKDQDLGSTTKENYTGAGLNIAFGFFCGVAIGK